MTYFRALPHQVSVVVDVAEDSEDYNQPFISRAYRSTSPMQCDYCWDGGVRRVYISFFEVHRHGGFRDSDNVCFRCALEIGVSQEQINTARRLLRPRIVTQRERGRSASSVSRILRTPAASPLRSTQDPGPVAEASIPEDISEEEDPWLSASYRVASSTHRRRVGVAMWDRVTHIPNGVYTVNGVSFQIFTVERGPLADRRIFRYQQSANSWVGFGDLLADGSLSVWQRYMPAVDRDAWGQVSIFVAAIQAFLEAVPRMVQDTSIIVVPQVSGHVSVEANFTCRRCNQTVCYHEDYEGGMSAYYRRNPRAYRAPIDTNGNPVVAPLNPPPVRQPPRRRRAPVSRAIAGQTEIREGRVLIMSQVTPGMIQ